MRVIVTTPNSSKLAGDAIRIIVDSDQIRFEFRGREELTFKKDNYNEERFTQVQNYLRNVSVSSKSIALVNISRGEVIVDATDTAALAYKALFSEDSGVGAPTPSAPLIDGKFTQEPQGNITSIDKTVLDSFSK